MNNYMMQNDETILASIPPTGSDTLLLQWGYNLGKEYLDILRQAELDLQKPLLELATGPGRMSSILTRLGYNVVTGDVSMKDRETARERIGKEYLQQVTFLHIDMESLSFGDGEFSSVISMNTFHHLDHPDVCLKELIRVHSGDHSLIIGDFNDHGFDVLQNVHQTLHGKDHPRGTFNMQQLKPLLESIYSNVKEVQTTLDLTYIATGKKKV
jgi:ubiquinone/menaquinone biosynthesis C-methylase UbiE